MEVIICIPLSTPEPLITVARLKYPDIYEDEGWDDHRRFFLGKSSDSVDEDDPEEVALAESFLDYDTAVEVCGFMEGLFGEDSNTLMEGNGGWAQGMLSRRDFDSMVISDEEKAERTRRSELWWASHAEGEKAVEALKAAGALMPLFIPLKREYFEAFKSGEKTQEYRPLGPRWNDRTCAIGRPVVLSLGYGKAQRLQGVITSFHGHPMPNLLPGWSACYGDKHSTAAVIKISLTSPTP